MTTRRWAAAIGGLAMTVAVTACADNGDATESDLGSSGSQMLESGAESESLAGYSTEEVAAYDDAVAALERNLEVGLSVYHEGLATPAAYRALATVYTGEELADEWENLRNMDAADGYLDGSATVVWTKPIRILVSDAAGTVDLKACIDRSQMRAFTRDGGEIGNEGAFKRAVFQVTIDLGKGHTWRVAGGEEIGTC
ncbi:MAG: hypothetical protein ACRDP2_03970 [Nocardioidaceae bacterium]